MTVLGKIWKLNLRNLSSRDFEIMFFGIGVVRHFVFDFGDGWTIGVLDFCLLGSLDLPSLSCYIYIYICIHMYIYIYIYV